MGSCDLYSFSVRWVVAVNSLFFFVTLLGIVPYWLVVRRRRGGACKSLVPWYGLGIALLLIIIFHVLNVADHLLFWCNRDSNVKGPFLNLTVAGQLSVNLAEIVLLAVSLVLLNNGVARRVGHASKALTITSAFMLVVLFALACALAGMTARTNDAILHISSNESFDAYQRIVRVQNQVGMAYYYLALGWALIGAAVQFWLVLKTPEKKPLLTWSSILNISFISYFLMSAIYLSLQLSHESYVFAVAPLAIVIAFQSVFLTAIAISLVGLAGRISIIPTSEPLNEKEVVVANGNGNYNEYAPHQTRGGNQPEGQLSELHGQDYVPEMHGQAYRPELNGYPQKAEMPAGHDRPELQTGPLSPGVNYAAPAQGEYYRGQQNYTPPKPS